MLVAQASNAGTPTASLPAMEESQDPQIQDLESLAQRIRAIEKLLAPPPTSKAIMTAAETESPIEEASKDDVGSSSPPHQQGHHQGSNRHGHHHHRQPNNVNHTPGSLSRRVQQTETKLWAAIKERKTIDEFLQKYESSKLINNPYDSHPDRELLTLQAKTELIFAAQEDLQKLSEESKEIQNLQPCAEIGGLKNIESHYPALSKLETIHVNQLQETNNVSDKINKLIDDYNSLINTLSEVFLSWDGLLAAAELKVSEVERSRNQA